MPAVDSSAISYIHYHVQSRTLFVRFKDSGELYAYFDVPEAEYDAFLAAESKGGFFAERVRERFDFHHVR